MKLFLNTTAKRLVFLLRALDVEGAEISSLIWALVWLIPILSRPDFLGISPLLYGLRQLTSEPAGTIVLLLLVAWHTIGIVFGGLPSTFIRNNREFFNWILFRQAGLYISGGVWSTVAYVLGIIPGGIFSWYLVAACAWGIWRLGFALQVERSAIIERNKSNFVPQKTPAFP